VRSRSVGVVLVAAALLLGACSSEDDKPDGDNDRAACTTNKGTLVVGVIAPLSGVDAAQGKSVENATKLAVDQANKNCAVNGYKLTVQSADDGSKPDLGAQAATLLASGKDIVGVVSTVDSDVAAKVAPILDKAGILQISPGDTADSLSRGADFQDSPKRPFTTYFRTCAVGTSQSRFAANYLVDKAKRKNIAVVADGQPDGEGLADAFADQVEEKGGKVATRQRVNPNVLDFAAVIAAVQPFTPDALFFGGGSAQAAALNIPVVGGDELRHDAFLATGGKDGDLATSVGAPVEDLSTAKAFAKAYQAAGFTEDAGVYGAFAYDAANAIIGALATTVGDGKWSPTMKDKLVANAGKYAGDGATGKIAFDKYGDATNHVLTVYKATAGKWDAVETGKVD
jgi:branched-chain amino acid transport system substrate-binding protein